MTKKQIIRVVMVCAGYALGCWGAYRIGKDAGKAEAYSDCADNILGEMYESFKERYPDVFAKTEKEETA